jgi:hypothetical protein
MTADTRSTVARLREWLIDAHARLLEARHDQAHNGDVIKLGAVGDCEICVGAMRDFIGHLDDLEASHAE